MAEAFRRDWTIVEVQMLTQIDPFYLHKIRDLVLLEQRLQSESLTTELLRFAKVQGFSDLAIAKLTGRSEETVRSMRLAALIVPVYKTVDTCAAEFASATPYYYSCYEEEDEVSISTGPKVVVLGSGPIRIGQGIEFDYCSVHALSALQEVGVESIMINNNPETVSTDFDTADKLYFEPLTLEDVLHVLNKEKADGVLVQFGGQTAINLAGPLNRAGIRILGTQVDAIDMAEDRERFAQLLSYLEIPQSEGRSVTAVEQAKGIAEELEFPVIVRPSYVIGGRAMQVVETIAELEDYLRRAIHLSPEHPILVDRYLEGKEVEVDAVSDGETTVIAGIMEHIERAGVHSGDSLAVYPPQSLSPAEIEQIQDFTCRLAEGIGIRGLINIQFVVVRGKVFVLEVNPRASRTVPILSKVTGIPLVNLAVQVSLGKTLKDMGYAHGLAPEAPFVVVKAPVFSFEKLTKVETSLGPEMKSTGEVLGMDTQFGHALAKAFAASHIPLPKDGNILVSVAEKDRPEAITLARQLAQLGFGVKGTGDTAKALALCGVAVEEVSESSEVLREAIRQREFSFILSTPTKGTPERTGYLLRRLAAEHGVPCFTSMDTAKAVVRALQEIRSNTAPQVLSLQEYLAL